MDLLPPNGHLLMNSTEAEAIKPGRMNKEVMVGEMEMEQILKSKILYGLFCLMMIRTDRFGLKDTLSPSSTNLELLAMGVV